MQQSHTFAAMTGEAMNLTVDSLYQAAMERPPEDRAVLAERLYESVEPLDQGEIDRAWVVEIKARLEEYKQGKVKGVPADEVH